MEKNLEIIEIDVKLTKAEKKYWRFKTNMGWMSCFDETVAKQVKAFVGGTACCEVNEKKTTGFHGEDRVFYNIVTCYGEAAQIEDSADIDEKPEVVKMGKAKGKRRKARSC